MSFPATPIVSAAEAAEVLLNANGHVRAVPGEAPSLPPAYIATETEPGNVRVFYHCSSPNVAVAQADFATVLFADAGWRTFRESGTPVLAAIVPTWPVAACSTVLGSGQGPLVRAQWDQYGKVSVAGIQVIHYTDDSDTPVRLTWRPRTAETAPGSPERLEHADLWQRRQDSLQAARELLEAAGWEPEVETLGGLPTLLAYAPWGTPGWPIRGGQPVR